MAEAFDILESSGKVRAFGVSNHNPMQIELLNQYCGGIICIDQIQFSAAHCPTIDAGLYVNIHNDAGCNRDGGLIEYVRLKKITLRHGHRSSTACLRGFLSEVKNFRS